MLFDLPDVAELARTRLINTPVRARFEAHGGSFLNDVLPKGADIASLVRVIHDHGDAAAMRILRAVRVALPDDGRLLLAEPMAETPGAEAMGDAYFGFYLMAMGHGRPRSAATLTRMLEAAGFEAVRRVATHTPLQTQLLVARCARRVFEDQAPDPLSDQMWSST
jgi:demethylspheroidene O-methyltransferase